MASVVLNPGFEVDLSSWTKQDADVSTTWTRDTTVTNGGSVGSSKLVNTVAGADDYIFQDVNNLGLGLNPGETYIVTAWVNVTVFTAAAVSNRGLAATTFPSGTLFHTGGDITASTGGWILLTLPVQMPANQLGLEVRLYAPQGTTYWDDVSVAGTTIVKSFQPIPFQAQGRNL